MTVDKEKLRALLDGLSADELRSLRAMINGKLNAGKPRKPGGGRKRKDQELVKEMDKRYGKGKWALKSEVEKETNGTGKE